MIKDTGRCESESRAFSAIRIPTGVRVLAELGKANSRVCGVWPAASILVTTRASVSSVKESAITKATLVPDATGQVTGTSITGGNDKEESMKHRHIHAKKGEWIHVHRDNNSGAGCFGIVVAILVIGFLMRGC